MSTLWSPTCSEEEEAGSTHTLPYHSSVWPSTCRVGHLIPCEERSLLSCREGASDADRGTGLDNSPLVGWQRVVGDSQGKENLPAQCRQAAGAPAFYSSPCSNGSVDAAERALEPKNAHLRTLCRLPLAISASATTPPSSTSYAMRGVETAAARCGKGACPCPSALPAWLHQSWRLGPGRGGPVLLLAWFPSARWTLKKHWKRGILDCSRQWSDRRQ